MSMPSDMTADITEAMEAMPETVEAASKRFTTEQLGLIAAAAVAFLGIAFLGPALARIGKPKPLSQRAEDKARDLRIQAEAAALRARRAGARAGKRIKKQTRRLGGSVGWR